MAKISGVIPGSIAEEAGLAVGDEVLAVNGQELQDLIDYKYLSDDYQVTLSVVKADSGEEYEIEIEKDADEELGIQFSTATFDGMRRCNNRCSFCFIRQNPRGLRSSLYVYDDDYRLSFLQGHFVTLTNIKIPDWRRIVRYRLSPLYVSVHTTDPDVREKMLGTKKARPILRQLQFFARHGITVHVQIVLCPGLNDGHYLEQTLSDLASLYPAIQSVAVVPVGLTKFRDHLPPLRPVNRDEAEALVKSISYRQQQFRKKLGSRFVWMADEFFLTHDIPLPPATIYEDMPQLENGVGLVRRFADDFAHALTETKLTPSDKKVSIGTGVLGAKALAGPVERLRQIGVDIKVWQVKNQFFGEWITTSGLITGGDLIAALSGQELGEELLIPSATLREHHNELLFLDGTSLAEVEASLKVTITPLATAEELVRHLVS